MSLERRPQCVGPQALGDRGALWDSGVRKEPVTGNRRLSVLPPGRLLLHKHGGAALPWEAVNSANGLVQSHHLFLKKKENV